MASTTITFDAAIPAGFSLSGGTIVSGSVTNVTLAPNSTKYLTIGGGQAATITSAQGYKSISFDWGSPDTWNTLSIFDTLGNLITSMTGTATGIVGTPATKNFVYTLAEGQAPGGIGALKFASSTNAFELDNVTFASAVPEPSMVVLFAAAVGALFFARRKTRAIA